MMFYLVLKNDLVNGACFINVGFFFFFWVKLFNGVVIYHLEDLNL